MNPGAVEEVGQTTRSFMDAMKDQPLALALCIMNMALLGLFFYIAQEVGATRRKEFEMVFQQNDKVHQLLFQCVPQELREKFRLQSDESHILTEEEKEKYGLAPKKEEAKPPEPLKLQ